MAGRRRLPDLSDIYRGELSNLPALESNKIRVFLSSTFTDMAAERNYITAHTVPKLQQYCSKIGMEFEIVDMRWGVKDEASDDHMTTELVVSEIKRSQEQSRGPNFVNLLGNRYGSKFSPRKIDAKELESLLQVGTKCGKDTKVLTDWYRKDENAVPAEYILQRISSKLPYYNDNDPDCAEERSKAQAVWSQISDKLGQTLRDLADIAYKEGRISQSQHNKYFISVTEDEVREGILEQEANYVAKKTLVFYRELKDIRIKDKIAWRYIDLDDAGKLNSENQNSMKKLKREKIPLILSMENIAESSIPWNENGVTVDDPKHAKYLENFAKTMFEQMTKLIDDCGHEKTDMKSKLLQEVLHHSHFSLKKCEVFQGREAELKVIREKLFKSVTSTGDEKSVRFEKGLISQQNGCGPIKFNQPLIIYGDSATGKTALLAKVVQEAVDWLPNCVRLVRFLGTSVWSSNMKDVFFSLIMQLHAACGMESSPDNYVFSDVVNCERSLLSLLQQVARPDRPILVVLDAVDQLSELGHMNRASDTFERLPPNVYFILSTSNHHPSLMHLKDALPTDRLIEVSNLTHDETLHVIDASLRHINRRLTDDQFNFLQRNVQDRTSPLFMNIAMHNASVFTSYFDIANFPVMHSVTDLISHYFEGLERDNGRIIMERSLGYLTLSKNGISDHEMLDLLSLDDEVLQDTYLWHLPANNQIRIPTSVWRRVYNDLEDYLTIRRMNGKQLLKWYYCQFRDVTRERYITNESRQILHRNLVDYFTGEYSSKAKPIDFYKVKKGSYPDANRQVPEQPLIHGPHMANLRKMSELPYHLVKSGQFEKFKDTIAGDFEWLYQKTKHMSAKDVMLDLTMALEEINAIGDIDSAIYEEILEIKNLYFSLYGIVKKDASLLGPTIIGSLDSSYKKFPRIWSMVQQARKWCESTVKALLVPDNVVFPQTRGVLLLSFEVDMHKDGGSMDMTSSLYVIKERLLHVIEEDRQTIRMYDIKGFGEVISSRTMHSKIKSVQAFVDKCVLVEFYKDNPPDGTYKELYTASLAKKIAMEDDSNIVVSPQGKYLAVFCREKRPSGFKLMTLTTKSHQNIAAGVSPIDGVFTPDECHLVTITLTGTISIWSTDNGSFLRQVAPSASTPYDPHGNGKVVWMALDSHLLLSTSDPGKKKVVNVFSLETGSLEHALQNDEDFNVDLMAVDKSQERVATASRDWMWGDGAAKAVCVWDPRKGQLLSVCRGKVRNRSIGVLKFYGEKEEYLILGTRGRPLEIWYIGSFNDAHPEATLVKRIYEYPSHMLDMVTSGDDLIVAQADNCIRCFALDIILREAKEKMRQSLIDIKEPPYSVDIVLSMHLKCIVTSSSDGCLRIFDKNDGTLLDTIQAHDGLVTHAVLSADGQFCVTCADNEQVKVWDIHGRKLSTLLNESKSENILCMAEANSIVAACNSEKELCSLMVWQLDTGVLLFKHVLSSGCPWPKVALTSDGNKVITAVTLHPLLFDTKTGACYEVADPTASKAKDGDQIKQGDNTDKGIMKMSGCSQIQVASNDKLAAVGFTDGSVHIVTTGGKLVTRIQLESSRPVMVFTHDCTHIVIGNRENIGVWTVGGELKVTIKRHSDHVTNFRLCLQDRFLVTSSDDHTILVWDLTEARSVASFITHSPVTKMTVTPDLNSIFYIPDKANHLGILKPNPALKKALCGADQDVSETVKLAQALAFGFSSTKAEVKTSQTCVVL